MSAPRFCPRWVVGERGRDESNPYHVASLYFQDKENVTSGPHVTTGTADDGSLTTGNDRTEYHFAQTLDRCAIKADDGSTGLDLLALGGDVLETLTFEFDGIKPDMHNQLNAIPHRNAKGMPTWKELDQVPGHGSHGYLSRWIDSHPVTGHLLCKHFVRNLFQLDNCAIKWRKNGYLCHCFPTLSLSYSLLSSVPPPFMM